MKQNFLARFMAIVGAVFVLVLSVAIAEPNGGNKLQTFDGTTDGGYGGSSTILDGVAILNNTDGNVNGSYSGVYIIGSNLNGKLLADVGQLSFVYTGDPTAGSPRISLPLDINSDGITDVYAFIGATYCNNGAGLVDAIKDPTCTIFVTGGDIGGYSDWQALIAAYPTARVGPDGALPFVIADDAGLWTVSDVRLGKASRLTGK